MTRLPAEILHGVVELAIELDCTADEDLEAPFVSRDCHLQSHARATQVVALSASTSFLSSHQGDHRPCDVWSAGLFCRRPDRRFAVLRSRHHSAQQSVIDGDLLLEVHSVPVGQHSEFALFCIRDSHDPKSFGDQTAVWARIIGQLPSLKKINIRFDGHSSEGQLLIASEDWAGLRNALVASLDLVDLSLESLLEPNSEHEDTSAAYLARKAIGLGDLVEFVRCVNSGG
jgi:hypothetical protein